MRLANRHYPLILLVGMLVMACKSTPHTPAPVSEISTKSQTSKISNTSSSSKLNQVQEKDWRPDLYTVKKGDTLYSIGLEHGFDYKEIAQINQIDPPYTIQIGQSLKLKALKSAGPKSKPVEAKHDNNVVTKPLNSDNSSPQGKSLDEPITAKPLDESSNISNQESVTSNSQNTTQPTNPSKELPDINEGLVQQSRPTPNNTKSNTAAPSASNGDWSWPSKGKVINPFVDGGNAKGIDIEGVLGQEVNAAGSGKVIYNGGDLRGYGNMVIIKHDKDLLSVYAHNSKLLVKEGQLVTKGQKIAEMGNTGTDKVKLHFEIRFQGKSVDPIKYLGSLPQ